MFEFFFKTFFGIEAKVTRRAVQWLIATPVYTDSGDYAELNELRSYMTVAGWALFTLVLTVSGVRYYASGFTSGGSYEAVEALARGGLAAGALAIYPEVFGSLSVADELPDVRDHARARGRARAGEAAGGGDGRRASRRWGSGRSPRSSRSCCWCCC